jgi:nicotinamide-nucleotide amidase
MGIVMDESDQLDTQARRVAALLSEQGQRLVLAESCTCGLIAAVLGGVPGISSVLCGSAVTYREATKMAWLDVRPITLEEETAVSDPVARQMVEGVLRHTPEATLAASITGHLGPDAPTQQDGLVFIGLSERGEDEIVTVVRSYRLKGEGRLARRREAVGTVLHWLAEKMTVHDEACL